MKRCNVTRILTAANEILGSRVNQLLDGFSRLRLTKRTIHSPIILSRLSRSHPYSLNRRPQRFSSSAKTSIAQSSSTGANRISVSTEASHVQIDLPSLKYSSANQEREGAVKGLAYPHVAGSGIELYRYHSLPIIPIPRIVNYY